MERPSSAIVLSTSDKARKLKPADTTRVQVAVRVRPINRADGNDSRFVVRTDETEGNVIHAEFDQKGKKSYFYDYVFSKDQEEVHDCIGKPMLLEAFKGFNVCLFAYGQTGSGKTHSIQGDMENGTIGPSSGILLRLVHDIFRYAEERMNADTTVDVRVTLSYLEIYMEKVRDLLTPRSRGVEPEALEVHEDVNHHVYVKGISVHRVHNLEKVWTLVQQGNGCRQTAETRMNEFSSRSHSIVQFTISQTYDNPTMEKPNVESVVSLVDLAGSERQSKTESTGLQLDEAKKINLSLTTLGRVLRTFSEGKVGQTDAFLPLRESKLTRLLSECFGGNSKTWMLATISPTSFNQLETQSTLDYATMAKSVTNKAIINKLRQQLELKEMKEQYGRMEVAYSTVLGERDDVRSELQRVMAEKGALEQGALESRRETERLMAEVALLRAQLTTVVETPRRAQTEMLDMEGSMGATPRTSRMDPNMGLSSLYVARTTVTLTTVLEQKAMFYTLPLQCTTGVPGCPALQVKIYPVDSNGVGAEAPSLAINPETLIGQRVDFVVHVMGAQDIPKMYSHNVYCRYVFKWAEKEPYKSREVRNSTCPQFDHKKRFAFSKMNTQLLNYFKAADVITFEVFGVAGPPK